MPLLSYLANHVPRVGSSDESLGAAEISLKTKHAYTAWDEEYGHHWFLVDTGSSTGKRTLYVKSDVRDTLDPHSVWSTIADALRQDHFSIHISGGSWSPCSMVNRFEGPNLVMSEPVVDESSLRFVRQVMDGRGLGLVEMGGELFVHKYAVKPELLVVLQCEVENYKRLEQSPFVLRISHAVQSHSSDFGGQCVRGFLLPYVGKALASEDWVWSIEEKEYLMLDILDAVHDFEIRGVVHTDLKCANILLTPDGLKLIDLDFLGSTSPWSSPFEDDSRKAAVHTFGKTIWELFTEQVPHDKAMNEVEVEGSLPPYVTDLVRDCCVEHKYKCVKQLYDATEQVLDPVRARRVPSARLITTQAVNTSETDQGEFMSIPANCPVKPDVKV